MLILESTKNSMTMMVVTRTASMAPMTRSRLRWRMNARKSLNAARGPTGRGNQDIAANVGVGFAPGQPRLLESPPSGV